MGKIQGRFFYLVFGVLAVAVAYLTNKVWVFDSKSFAPAVLSGGWVNCGI